MRSRPMSDRSPQSVRLRLASPRRRSRSAACSTPPATRFYSLMPAEVAPRAAQGRGERRRAADRLEPIRVPAQVDQPQWLVRLPDDSVAVLEQERWASPLRDEFRAGAARAADRRPRRDRRAHAAGAGRRRERIAVDVRRFDSLPGRRGADRGLVDDHRQRMRAAASRCEWLIREPAPGSFAALAAAHRRAVAASPPRSGRRSRVMRRGETAGVPGARQRR